LLADRTNVKSGKVTDQIRKQVCHILKIQLDLTHSSKQIKLLKGEEVETNRMGDSGVQVYKIVVLQNPDNRMNMQKKVERTN
jgi:hypothetical protein